MDSEIKALQRQTATGDTEAQLRLDRKLTRADIPQKVYVINRIRWEYNDEYHYAEGKDGTVLVYRDREMAARVCAEKEFEAFKETFVSNVKQMSWGSYNMARPLGDYYPDWDMSRDLDNIPPELLEKLGLTEDTLPNFRFPEDADEEDVRAMFKCLSVSFFELEEVDFYG